MSNILEYIELLKKEYIEEKVGQYGIFYTFTNPEGTVHYRLWNSNVDQEWYIGIRIKNKDPEIDGLFVLSQIYNSDDLNDWINVVGYTRKNNLKLGFTKLR